MSISVNLQVFSSYTQPQTTNQPECPTSAFSTVRFCVRLAKALLPVFVGCLLGTSNCTGRRVAIDVTHDVTRPLDLEVDNR